MYGLALIFSHNGKYSLSSCVYNRKDPGYHWIENVLSVKNVVRLWNALTNHVFWPEKDKVDFKDCKSHTCYNWNIRSLSCNR